MAETEPTLSFVDLRADINKLFSAKSSQKTIGLELELIPFKSRVDGTESSVDIRNKEESGIYDLLRGFSRESKELFDTPKEDGTPQLSSIDGGNITFEPGGQIEYSTSQGVMISDAIKEITRYHNIISRCLSEKDIWMFFGGMNPWESVLQVGLKNSKPRYQAMDSYFKSINQYGQQMMRLTTSLQVNLDLGNSEETKQRWLAANLLSPILCAIFSNSPFHAGEITNNRSYRSATWQNLDKCRTGFPHLSYGTVSNTSPEQQYYEYAINANVILLPDSLGNVGYVNNVTSFRQWMTSGFNGYYPDMKDWKTHLTLLFPEVRPKGFFEFRAVDGQCRAWWTVPSIVVTAILYDEAATGQVIDLLQPYYSELKNMLSKASIEGVKAFPELAKRIFKIALNASEFKIEDELRDHCEHFYKTYTHQEKSPADDLLELNNGRVFTSTQYFHYEEKQIATACLPDYAVCQSQMRNSVKGTEDHLSNIEASANSGDDNPRRCCFPWCGGN
ncbi:hypothetical protein KKA14_15550 [bacterium]|nr:hypothetical protein [bacterium]